MLKEIRHFIRTGPEIRRLQKQLPRARFVDQLFSRIDEQGYADVRRELVADLGGRVLEIGCGTGSMFGYYGPGAEVVGIEPDEELLPLACDRARASGGRIVAARGDGMQLDWPDASFDAVVLGLVLCSVPSMERVLAEAFRVLRPGGALRALEHVRSERLVPGLLMDAWNPVWMRINGMGCRLNRDPLPRMREAGFALDEVQEFKRFDTWMAAFPMRRVRGHRPA